MTQARRTELRREWPVTDHEGPDLTSAGESANPEPEVLGIDCFVRSKKNLISNTIDFTSL